MTTITAFVRGDKEDDYTKITGTSAEIVDVFWKAIRNASNQVDIYNVYVKGNPKPYHYHYTSTRDDLFNLVNSDKDRTIEMINASYDMEIMHEGYGYGRVASLKFEGYQEPFHPVVAPQSAGEESTNG